ncbi:hypothetical protein [Rhodoplanes sp. Z2-YC6860]|uniref:hypothetical protein n=1 Tax=Rhodoplanes sp. Z2-YC6860 TaxID=674703 RepID=UPI00078D2BB6|nr:hypothetical protein [Rhodoplanes sp. Z2-YC6860]AMN43735.1 hypothetical protein RHPLAN_53180 [Rhodoplanes sp. Z2-YC6860]
MRRNAERGSSRTPQVLRHVVAKAIILAWREDVGKLQASLECEGFDVEVLRPDYTDEELKFSKNSRTFLNHKNAWEKAIAYEGYTLVCEADFVPCRGIGEFEVFWPADNPRAWGYLYQGSPRLLAIIGEKRLLRGHTAPLVSYVINSHVAGLMMKFFDYEAGRHDLRSYFTFDSHLQWYVMGLGAEAYIPWRHYGEHGGMPNPEHARASSVTSRGEHRADNLMSSLHFLPAYARGSHVSFLRTRFVSRLLGFARLAMGRWIAVTNVYNLTPVDRARMYLIGFRRLLSYPL